MATGTDFLLESLLRLAGVDVENAKSAIMDLGKKFYEQDEMLRRIERNQTRIMRALKIEEDDDVSRERSGARSHAIGS